MSHHRKILMASGGGVILTELVPTSGNWQGSTGSASLGTGTIDRSSLDKAIEQTAVYSSDVYWQGTFTDLRGRGSWGFYRNGESFNENEERGGMSSMTNSYWFKLPDQSFSGGAIMYGGASQKSVTFANSDVLLIQRVGSTITAYRNGSVEHTFSQTDSNALRPVCGLGGNSSSGADTVVGSISLNYS